MHSSWLVAVFTTAHTAGLPGPFAVTGGGRSLPPPFVSAATFHDTGTGTTPQTKTMLYRAKRDWKMEKFKLPECGVLRCGFSPRFLDGRMGTSVLFAAMICVLFAGTY